MLKGSDQKFSITTHRLNKKLKMDIQHFLSTDPKWSVFFLPPSCSLKHVVSKLYSSECCVWRESLKDPQCRAEKSHRQKWASTLHLHPALSTEATVLMFNMLEFHIIFCLTKGVLTLKKEKFENHWPLWNTMLQQFNCTALYSLYILKMLGFYHVCTVMQLLP